MGHFQYLGAPKGPGKRGHIVEETLLPVMFLGLRKLGNICVGNNVSSFTRAFSEHGHPLFCFKFEVLI